MASSDDDLKADLVERPPRKCRFVLVLEGLDDERRQRYEQAATDVDPFGGNNNQRMGYATIARALTNEGFRISDLTVRRHLHPHESCCCGT